MKVNNGHLRAERDRVKLSRRQLAELSGVSKESIKRLELDPAASTKYETILALAQALGVPFAALSETEVPA